jgi:dihydroxyacetone kinase DhaKLM complex PTS-EIIA-like component DhaM
VARSTVKEVHRAAVPMVEGALAAASTAAERRGVPTARREP